MLVLVVDTATPAVTAALVEIGADEVRQVAARAAVDGRAHGELLAPQIDAVLAEAGAKPRDLGAVVAGVGPGPFTGLRVGLMTAAVFQAGLGIPAYGVCTLDAFGARTTGKALVATDARRREVYWAVYADGTALTGPAVDKPADIVNRLTTYGVTHAVGEGAQRYADVLGITPGAVLYPDPLALAELAAERVRAKAPTEPLTPLYLRRPDAVEPAARKAALSPAEQSEAGAKLTAGRR
ncbi:tRNA (adenosine(37)-N6)-threonylcarbamoyltransferase complex dimerization subunit type 1 TsaB [Catellatospora sp. TT07R-123]|uniref:tRNA (adenosine(37)-N6)-threonylcarbamoyltransferase complex dimerization subunit type 1 TsaB n=1 Tax=Catellatospora sp. TT07R-123 TaxID=2733863 RepID=UPI001B1EBAE2|nr:tRNA (adenosine(37)-N6)-threonylcarbamoyltransferase complex dimerization subunit type 1 TsaB [Catellatospora sp. TT07R-123]GHJ46097.1 tRNA (adenosine(37)-N6)-threonylcarbamoyltransferase complex dimerization subunit type 1 TsaB [Catellatospora sp. TT07R-123]